MRKIRLFFFLFFLHVFVSGESQNGIWNPKMSKTQTKQVVMEKSSDLISQSPDVDQEDLQQLVEDQDIPLLGEDSESKDFPSESQNNEELAPPPTPPGKVIAEESNIDLAKEELKKIGEIDFGSPPPPHVNLMGEAFQAPPSVPNSVYGMQSQNKKE